MNQALGEHKEVFIIRSEHILMRTLCEPRFYSQVPNPNWAFQRSVGAGAGSKREKLGQSDVCLYP
jgi:hypothetical protein